MKLMVSVPGMLIAILACGCSRQEQSASVDTSPTSVVVLSESNFDTQIQNAVVLVDFWATWCEPCRVQGPIVESLAEQLQGKAKVAKLDVDAAPKVAKRFNINSIPTLVIFKNGKPVKQFVGVTKAETLLAAITAAVGSE